MISWPEVREFVKWSCRLFVVPPEIIEFFVHIPSGDSILNSEWPAKNKFSHHCTWLTTVNQNDVMHFQSAMQYIYTYIIVYNIEQQSDIIFYIIQSCYFKYINMHGK